ncbi:Protein BATH-38 [Aphelenchoides avenae]|nr:Protein BATH-38 [Aphelenchus avenae]
MSEKTDPAEKITIALKINNVSIFMKKIGERTRSPLQEVAGIGWQLLAYPSVVDNTTYLSCFLEGVNASKWTAWVDATFRIVKKNGEGIVNNFSFRKLMGKAPLGNGWGWEKFGASKVIKNAVGIFGSAEIRVDFSVTDVCGASINVLENAGALAADIKLKVGNSVFYANKGYLSVVSSAFREMFALTAAADSNKETEELELKDLDANEFKEFLGVVYPTCYPITDTNVISLFRMADRYDVKRVIGDCEHHLYGANSVPWFDKLKLAVDLNRGHLKDHLISEITCDGIKTVNQNENKRQLGVDVLQALLEKHIRVCHP